MRHVSWQKLYDTCTTAFRMLCNVRYEVFIMWIQMNAGSIRIRRSINTMEAANVPVLSVLWRRTPEV